MALTPEVEEDPDKPMTWTQLAALMQIKSPSGAPFTVDDSVAPQFQGLLNDLEAGGYKIDPGQSGGYANRNIAGTNTPSKHASGRAIDINWSRNPQGQAQGDMPNDIAILAAKNGLRWGGIFSNPDPMHFEAPGNAPPVARGSPGVNSGGRGMNEFPADPMIPQQQAGGGSWQKVLEDPVNRSFLLSMGLQLMTGGWGNGVQQLAAGIGAGAEGAAGTEAALRKQANEERDFSQGVVDKQADRDSRMDVAKLGADSRMDVAQERVRGMLQRTSMNLDKAGTPVKTKYNELARKVVMGSTSSMSLSPAEQMQLIRAEADRLYTEDVMNGVIPPPAKGPVAEAAASGRPAAQAEAPVAPDKVKPGITSQVDALISGEKGALIKQKLATPEGQQELKTRFPKLALEIDEWVKLNQGKLEYSKDRNWMHKLLGIQSPYAPGGGVP